MSRPLLFIIVLEALSREIGSGCPEQPPYADGLALVNETPERLKGRLEAWKRALKLKRLRVNVKKTKVMISFENSGKSTGEGKFPLYIRGVVVLEIN